MACIHVNASMFLSWLSGAKGGDACELLLINTKDGKILLEIDFD